MEIVMLAPPGAGKGTQSKIISGRYDIPHIETGNILRSAIKEDTELGQKASLYISNGKLVPDDIMIDLVQRHIDRLDDNGGFVLDGFPRTVPQAEALEDGFSERGIELAHVIFLDVSDEVIFERLEDRRVCDDCGKTYHLEARPPQGDSECDECGGELVRREDDTRSSIKRRLDVYYEQTQPLLNFYRNRNLLLEIDGEQAIEQVADSIHDKLEQTPVGPRKTN